MMILLLGLHARVRLIANGIYEPEKQNFIAIQKYLLFKFLN